ncbi:hypothetical protein L7F22_049810 [Adiantum nelumboides]|nr:hypothetical protein [Adiantum nelumboides]
MGDAMKADGAFINQEVSVTPLIGKLRLHIQGYVDKEDFFISPLKHEDVILRAPWFDRLAASIKFLERKISFKFREKDMYINAQESGSSIPLVNDQAFDKSIKSSISAYMIFVKDSLNGVDVTQVNENGMQVDLELSNFLNQFQDVFIDDIPGELPPKRGDDDHMIELIPGSSPPNKPPYRVSQAQQEEIMRQVNELVEKGMVRPSSSPFCSPLLLVQKKEGTYRMCVNYRALNRITIKNRFPVPRVEDLFDKLQGSTYFSRIDLKSGYHQIRIVDEDIVKTAFRTSFGLYEYLVMPFGLTNAPATFNRMMERIFRPHRNFTGVFFDDVIIYSKTIEEHKEHLKVIFQALRDNKLYVNQKKSEFFLQEIQYLGHIISKNGIRMDPAKLEVIKDWPNPRNLHEVRSFIGASEETPTLVNYLITRLQQAMANPALQGEVQQQLQAYGFIPPHQEERIPEKSLGETSKRGISKVREGENPFEELQNLLLDDTHQSRRRGHAQRQEPPSKEKERSESPDESMEEDVAPRRCRVQRSPTPTKRKRSPHSPPRREFRKEEKDTKKKKERTLFSIFVAFFLLG